jgi:NTE family protein
MPHVSVSDQSETVSFGAGVCSVFDGLPADVVDSVLVECERRVYADGATLITEGEHPREMFVVVDGRADIFMGGRDGAEHLINQLGVGGALGELSLLTGEPASATVRAAGPLSVLVVSVAAFHALAQRFPKLYQNLGAMLALKVARADRRALGRRTSRLTVLEDHGAPDGLARALAASVAWHTRRSTLLLVLDQHAVSATERSQHQHLHITVTPRTGRFGDNQLVHTLDDLRRSYGHILIQSACPLPMLSDRTVYLLGRDQPLPRSADSRRGLSLRGWSTIATRRLGADSSGVVDLPALSATDEHEVLAGRLPPWTPAGARFGWAARDLAGLKVGLALGGGGLKGYAHLGVLRVLERSGLPVDYLAGTSVGGVVASLYALNHGPEAIADILDSAGATLVWPALSTRSLLSSDRLRRFLRSQGEYVRFEDLRLPLALVAADVASGREVVFQDGLVWPAALATVAIPGLFPSQAMGPYWLVDGGVLNPVPADVAADMGADVVIGVRLRDSPVVGRAAARSEVPAGHQPSVLEVLSRSIDLMQGRLAPRAEAAVDVLVEPRCEGAPSMGLRNFSRGRRYIQAGELAAEAALPRLVAALPWLAHA